MKHLKTCLWLSGLLLLGCGGGAPNANPQAENQPADDGSPWFSAWGTAVYTSFPNGPLASAGLPSTAQFTDNQAQAQSFRMMIAPTVGGDRVRVTLSNAFGDRPLKIQSVSIAKRAAITGPAIDGASATLLFSNGRPEMVIPAGGLLTTDAADFSYAYGEQLAVSFYVPEPSGPISWHAEAFATQYISFPDSGDVTSNVDGSSFLNIDRGFFFLQGLDVQIDGSQSEDAFSVVVFGDSITDGLLSIPEANQRYPDLLAQRIQNMGIEAGVVNAGINSNTVNPVHDPAATGIAGIDRFAEDVVNRSGVRSVFVLLGTNDLSAGELAEDVYNGLVNIAEQAAAAGICTLVSTILPRNDPPQPFGWDAATEEPQRQALNEMILASTQFDAVTDEVATALENPLIENQPNNVLFLEGLHPNPLGMQLLAEAIPLQHLLPYPYGDCGN